MQFKLLSVFILAFLTQIIFPLQIVTRKKECFNYDLKSDNGVIPREEFVKCGLTETKTIHTNPEIVKCVAEAMALVNKEGSLIQDRAKQALRQYAIPEFADKIEDLLIQTFNLLPEKIFPFFIKGMSLICPFDPYYGYL